MMLLSFWQSTFSGPFLERRLMKSPLASGSSYKMSVNYKLSQNNGWVGLASLDRMLNKDIIYFVNEMFEMESYQANFQLPDLCLCFLQPSVGHQLTASGCVVIHYRIHDNCALSRAERGTMLMFTILKQVILLTGLWSDPPETQAIQTP